MKSFEQKPNNEKHKKKEIKIQTIRLENNEAEILKEQKKEENKEDEIKNIRESLGQDNGPDKDIYVESYDNREEIELAAKASDEEYLSTEEGRKKDVKIRKSNKFKRWVARNVIQGALYGGSTLAGIFGFGNNAEANEIMSKSQDPEDVKNKTEVQVNNQEQISDSKENYLASFEEFEGLGPDPDSLSEQEKLDKEVFDKHQSRWESDSSYFVRDGNELKSVIRHSLSHLSGAFEDVRELRNSVQQIYDGVLSSQEIMDLYSYIETGAPDGHEGAVNRSHVENLQSIYNKIASAPSDKLNDNLTKLLEANSSEEGGIDSMYGIATAEASKSLILEKLEDVFKLSGLDYSPEKKEIDMNLEEMDEIAQPEREGYTSITLESGMALSPEQIHGIELFTAKMDDFQFDNLKDFIKSFESSAFDKIEITGMDSGNNVEYNGESVDFDVLNDLGTGKYDVHAGDYNFSFDYLREQGGDLKTFSDIKINYNGEHGEIKISADEVVKNINSFDRNDPSKEGFVRSVKGLELNAFNELKIKINELTKYENVNEVGGRVSDVNIDVGQWSISAESLKGTYATPEGNFDLSNMVDDIINNKAKIGDLVDRFDFSSGPMVIEDYRGTTKLEYDGENFFVNEFRVFKDVDGNFAFINNDGEGAVFEGGFSSYTKVNGEGMSTKDFVNKVVYEGAEVMLNSPDVEIGLSAMGGFIELHTGNISSEISEEILASYGKNIESCSKKISQMAKEFAEKAESGVFSDLIAEGLNLKNNIANEIGQLMDIIVKDGNIKMEDWSMTADFKTLSDNFKLIGEHEASSSVYKVDVLLKALGNDLGRITINQEFVDGYQDSSNKGDYVAKHVWGSSIEDLQKDFIDRASSQIGAQLLEQPTRKIMSIINATNNGSVEGLTLSPNELQVYYNLSKKLNPEGTNFILYANANLGDRSQNQETYINILDTPGKEHLNVGAEYKDYGGIGMIATRVMLDNQSTMVKAIGGLNLEFVKLNDLSLGFGDGQGNNYQVIDGENFFKLANMAGPDKSVDLMKRAIDNNWILPTPQAQLGIDVVHNIIDSKGGKTSLEGTLLASSNYLNTSLNLSLRAERDLGTLTGLPLTAGAKINTGMMLNGARHLNTNGEVFIRWDIGR